MEHAQAEQELRNKLGIKQGIAATSLGDDPAGRLCGVLLPELRRRSTLFGGQERPLEVVDSMSERIRKALGKTVELTQKEIEGLYPNPQELEKAWKNGAISQEQLDRALQGQRHTIPSPPSALPKAPAKRKSGSFGSQ
jgi:hypothetical protein